MEQMMEQLVTAIRRLEAMIHNDRAERKVSQERMDAKIDANLREIENKSQQ
jgi:hypothetical protein